VLPSDERVERGDEGRGGSTIVGEARGEEYMAGDGCGHVSSGKKELSGDAERTGSPLIAAVGVADVPASECLGENVNGA
jgi:hypothetical protein